MYAEIQVDRPIAPLTYMVPQQMTVCVHDRVIVPLGTKSIAGTVLSVRATINVPWIDRIKSITEKIEDVWSSRTRAMASWVSSYYYAPDISSLLGVWNDPSGWCFVDASAKNKKIAHPWAGSYHHGGTDLRTFNNAIKRGIATKVNWDSARSNVDILTSLASDHHARPLHDPTMEQSIAIESIVNGGAKTYALIGITGSGKTLVYQEAARRMLAQGKSVLLLVPEISLAPQNAERMRDAVGGRDVIMWHSSMSESDRGRALARARMDAPVIIVGPRSALWSPRDDIGLVIVDEEHDTAYKNQESPRYHARDAAVWYGNQFKVPVVLGTASPSLETWRNAKEGRYHILRLTARPSAAALPSVRIVDMRQYRGKAISPDLLSAIRDAQVAGHQSVILLNQRGWRPVASCAKCGENFSCPTCSVPMSLIHGASKLRCRACDKTLLVPKECPSCHHTEIDGKGMGTERLVCMLMEFIPGLRVDRLDADIRHRDAVLDKFRNHETDCLVGTQLVAKGIDIHNVTVVGVLGADGGLRRQDPRAAEHVFQLVTQVSGRAGRGSETGQAIIQVSDPSEDAIVCSVEGRYADFYQAESERRKILKTVPYYRCVRLVWAGSPRAVMQAAQDAAELCHHEGVDIDGPHQCQIPVIDGKARHEVLLWSSRKSIIDSAIHNASCNHKWVRPSLIDSDPLEWS